MKLWQLYSITRDNREMLYRIALKHSTNDLLLHDWYVNIDAYIAIQNRDILDFKLPESFVEEVLENISDLAYIDSANKLAYAYPIGGGTALNLFDLYKKVGADRTEELYEKSIISL